MDRPNPRAYLGLVVLLSQGRGFCAACWWLRCATRVARSYCLSSTLRTLPMRRSNTTPTEDHSDTVRHVSLLLPRDAMLARYILSLCVRLSVCQSVRHKPILYRNDWKNRAGFWHGGFFRPVLQYTVLWWNSGTYKNNGTFLSNFFLNSGLREFCCGLSMVETCYQLSSRKVDTQSMINWTVVCQLSLQYLRAPTLDRCSLSLWSSGYVYSHSVARVN